MKEKKKQGRHPWEARLIVGAIMVILAFFGMVVTDVHSGGGWSYWKWVVPVYALLALWLSWYMRRQQKDVVSPITLGHELLHWVGVIAAVFLVSFFVKLGLASSFLAGIFHLTILSLGVFLAGIYIESTFLFIGLVLGAVAMMSAVVVQYLYAIIVPFAIGSLIILGLIIWMSHQDVTKD